MRFVWGRFLWAFRLFGLRWKRGFFGVAIEREVPTILEIKDEK